MTDEELTELEAGLTAKLRHIAVLKAAAEEIAELILAERERRGARAPRSEKLPG